MPQVKKVTDNIIHINFDTVEEMNNTFCRISSYLDWAGHNIPYYGMKPFIYGDFDPLSPEEQFLVNLVRYRTDNYYIIGTNNETRDTVYNHELAHAFYGTNKKYRDKVDSLIGAYSNKELKSMKDLLKKLGYHEDVFVDEIHAYVGTDYEYVEEKWKATYPEKLQKDLTTLFEKHKKELKTKK
jgi:hypothetical protein